MLGIGPDGHVASLFPGHPQLDVTDRIAVPVTGSPKPPPERISLTFPALNRTHEVWFLVSGDGKADAVARALADEGSVHATPARGITVENATWFLDTARRLPPLRPAERGISARPQTRREGVFLSASAPSGDSCRLHVRRTASTGCVAPRLAWPAGTAAAGDRAALETSVLA